MASPVGTSFLDHFAALRDPRQGWKVVFPLSEVLLVVRRHRYGWIMMNPEPSQRRTSCGRHSTRGIA
jgi:hypothetical protein